MNINVSRRQTIGGLAGAALLAGLFAVGLSNPLPADDPAAAKADDFSPYVTKDGGISLPLDYREKFLHLGSWAVATKPDHRVYIRIYHGLHKCRTRFYSSGNRIMTRIAKSQSVLNSCESKELASFRN